ncbi:MAG TPA: substrate-binding domain-containing protein [Streptosporangiaceae bacterium]
MRRFVRLMAGAAAAASVAALTMAPSAMADPPSGKTVHNFDLSGIGADTTQSLFDQFSADYNAAQSAAHKADSASNPYLYSWDATNPTTQAIGDSIKLKKGCAALPRPDGASAGVVALTTLNKSDGTVGTGKNKRQTFCIDYVRSARNRSTTDPPYSKGGLAFITLAGDAITYATQPGSAAPSDLTTLQLFDIYTCKVTNWKQVGGKNAPIKAFIPQSGSGIRTSFLSAIGIPSGGSPGTCVSDESTKKNPGGALQQNEGVNVQLNKNKPDVIVPFSVGKYLAEVYHSAKCLNHFCKVVTSGADKGKICLPSKTQNEFGCDNHGTLVLNSINHTAPTTPFPLPKPSASKSSPVINKNFTALFDLTQYVVVPFSTAKGSVNGIAPYLVPFFGPNGFTCTSKIAKKDLANYGFRVYGKGSAGGHSITKCGDTH